jgi:polyisoprenoid-binding protein YceI
MVLARLPILLFAPVWLALVAPVTTVAQALPAGVYSLNRAESSVGFTITGSMLFKVKRDGSFRDFTGNMSYDPGNPANTHIDLTVYTESVDMHNAENTQLMKSSDFFDVERFPTMHFVSASTVTAPDGRISMTGDMTIRGVTKRMTIPVTMHRESGDSSHSGAIFESTFQIDRTEFGLNGTPKWGGFKVSVSKKVDIHIAIATTVSEGQPQR